MIGKSSLLSGLRKPGSPSAGSQGTGHGQNGCALRGGRGSRAMKPAPRPGPLAPARAAGPERSSAAAGRHLRVSTDFRLGAHTRIWAPPAHSTAPRTTQPLARLHADGPSGAPARLPQDRRTGPQRPPGRGRTGSARAASFLNPTRIRVHRPSIHEEGRDGVLGQGTRWRRSGARCPVRLLGLEIPDGASESTRTRRRH